MGEMEGQVILDFIIAFFEAIWRIVEEVWFTT